jgi:hypothetical protein
VTGAADPEGHQAVDGDPGVVHRDVEAAVLVDELARHPPEVIGQADVAFVQRAAALWVLNHVPAVLPRRVRQAVLRNEDHLRSCSTEIREPAGPFGA